MMMMVVSVGAVVIVDDGVDAKVSLSPAAFVVYPCKWKEWCMCEDGNRIRKEKAQPRN
jgi:hypothetical protein